MLFRSNGDYNVVCSDSNGCELEAAIFNVLTGVSGSFSYAGLKLSPNPVSDQLHLTLRPAGNARIQKPGSFSIINVEGRVVMVCNPDPLTQSEFTINVSKLSAGVYWLQAGDAESIVRCKFIRLND